MDMKVEQEVALEGLSSLGTTAGTPSTAPARTSTSSSATGSTPWPDPASTQNPTWVTGTTTGADQEDNGKSQKERCPGLEHGLL